MIIGEDQRVAIASGHLRQLAAVVNVSIGQRVNRFGLAHTVGIVSEVPGCAALSHAGKLPARDSCVFCHNNRQLARFIASREKFFKKQNRGLQAGPC